MVNKFWQLCLLISRLVKKEIRIEPHTEDLPRSCEDMVSGHPFAGYVGSPVERKAVYRRRLILMRLGASP